MNRTRTQFLLVAAIAALIVFAIGCSDEATGPSGDSNIALDLNFESPKLLQVIQVSSAELKVIALDIEDTIRASAAVTPGGTFELEARVPTGPARIFILELYSPQEILLYRGIQVMSVRPGVVNRVPVRMFPMVPMLKLTPKEQTVTGGQDAFVELRVYNLDSLTAVDTYIDYGAFDNIQLLDPLRASLASGLPSTTNFIAQEGEGGYRVRVADTTGAVFSAGPEGRTLANIRFGTRAFVDPNMMPLAKDLTFNFYTVLRNGIRVDSAVYPEVSQVGVLPIPDRVLTFPDSSLQAEIALRLTDFPDSSIFLSDALTIRFLGLYELPIADMTGIGQLENLTQLETGYNEFSDITPIGELKLLTLLAVEGNGVTNIAAVRNLSALRTLNLYSNMISDLGPVAGLTNLRNLNVSFNQLTDISPLKEVTTLWDLNLSNNAITNISALENLTGLSNVNLANNQITDLSALLNNPGIGSFDTVDVRNNPLSGNAIETQLTLLRQRGVTVLF